MKYTSTRGSESISAAEAIVQGLAPNGGLYVPKSFPKLSERFWKENMPYADRFTGVTSAFLPEFDNVLQMAKSAYTTSAFDTEEIAPVVKSNDGHYYLELWHGPTSAFKDMALQFLPHILTKSLELTGEKNEICILTATSGDTGKAALEGFKNAEKTRVFVFYPKDGVSEIQKLQMTSQEGRNVAVAGIVGNFDDAQTGVKALFNDTQLQEKAKLKGLRFSSANSINFGRLLPQIAYYVSAYADMVRQGHISAGDKLNFCVPTGNFGNILAGWYAKQMGLPIGKLICASNKNDVLTQLLTYGCYNKNREFFVTSSPSMDIIISSNWERCLYHFLGNNDDKVGQYMNCLQDTGEYTLDKDVLEALQNDFACGFCDEENTQKAINESFFKSDYLIDPHTAVARYVYDEYQAKTGDTTPTVIISTASPYKFCRSVLLALGQDVGSDDTSQIDLLESVSGVKAPAPLSSLKNKTVRFPEVINIADMSRATEAFFDK